MKKTILITAILAGLFIKTSAQEEIRKNITVKEAVVYLRGAKVSGTAAVNLQKGKNLVKIVNLPNDIDENTYKISLDKNSTLLSITLGTDFLKESETSDSEKPLLEEQKNINLEIKKLDVQINALTGEKGIINQNLSISHDDRFSAQEQLIKLTEFYRKRILEIDKSLLDLSEQKTVFTEKISKIALQLSEVNSHKNLNRKELLLEIFSENAYQMNLGVSYYVSSAGWSPNYDLRAMNTKSPLEIIYKGKIYQKTGQDWENIKLSVSTYLPNFNQNRPILNPMYVRDYIATTAYPSTNYEISAELSNSYQMREKSKNAGSYSEIPIAELTENQMNIVYELKLEQSILSQEKAQFVILDKRQVEADYKYHTVPKESNKAYLLALVKNWQNLDLISGEANIFFDENYIGKTQITSNYVKDEFPISLGIDERIVVKRTKLLDKNENKVLSGNKREIESYEISIRNNTKESIELEILDQIPISESSKISVKMLESSGGEFDEKTGSLLWKKTIQPGKSDKINFSYEVRFPKDSQIQYYKR
ncbi:MAG: DUF4139 domain-containing protein [Flavobacteriaceae bacterium]|jgi:uncharacterized protein (TIGR02231 family)|nr:DUF4139 domain-containing protein [Flavobacteriaceae bacterium]